MNNSSVIYTFDRLSDTLNVNPEILGIIFTICLTTITAIFIYLKTRHMIISLITPVAIPLFTSFIGLTPIWIMPIYIAIAIVLVLKQSYIDNNSVSESYRDSLIRAYEAKFGYNNPAFNEEVDSHIKAVETLRKGYTRAAHRDKLKRLEKFVEVR